MPDGMLLKSTPSASSISAPRPGGTLADYCRAHGTAPLREHEIVSRDLFVRYGLWFADRHVPEVEERSVTRVGRAGDGFEVELEATETVRAGAVVVASGLVDYAYVPPSLAHLEADRKRRAWSHSAEHGDLNRFSNRRVALVGAGQSSLELAALIREAGGEPVVVARRPRLVWGGPPPVVTRRIERARKPPSPLGPGYSLRAVSSGAGLVRFLPATTRMALVRSVLGPAGAWWLRGRVEGEVDVRLGRTVRNATAGADGVTLELGVADGTREELEVDHVIAATGYRVDLDRARFIDEDLRRSLRRVGGSPVLGPTFESSTPGLYFTGLAAAATFGPLMRFVAGTRFAATRISAAFERSRPATRV
jgi:thioredoxin reductase